VAHEAATACWDRAIPCGADARRMDRKDASEMSRLSLHLTKQEARKAVARLILAEPADQREQSQTSVSSYPVVSLRGSCRSNGLMYSVAFRKPIASAKSPSHQQSGIDPP
jgi:hypothetical protein